MSGPGISRNSDWDGSTFFAGIITPHPLTGEPEG